MPALLNGLIALLVVLILAQIVVVTRLRRRSEGSEDEGGDEPGSDAEEMEPLDLSYAARVVTREDGETVGESLCLAEDRVIVKAEEGFYAVPEAKVAEAGEQLRAEDVDWDQAREQGGAWAEENNDPIRFDEDGMPSR